MRDRPERFVVLPFSIGCVSHSSVSVANEKPRRSADLSSLKVQSVGENAKNQSGISWGLQRVMKGLKGLSQMFVYREAEEEEEREMVIGFPTDVKHVGHIGWDGSNNLSTTTKGWNHIPSLSLTQFEVAMSQQAHRFS